MGVILDNLKLLRRATYSIDHCNVMSLTSKWEQYTLDYSRTCAGEVILETNEQILYN